MLQPAIKYKEQLEKKSCDTWFKEKYKYYHANGYYEKINIDEDT